MLVLCLPPNKLHRALETWDTPGWMQGHVCVSSGLLEFWPDSVFQTSQTDTQMDVDNRNQTAGQHSPEARSNTPGCNCRMFLQVFYYLHFNRALDWNISILELGQPAMSGPLTGQQGSLAQPSEHATQHNVMEVRCCRYVASKQIISHFLWLCVNIDIFSSGSWFISYELNRNRYSRTKTWRWWGSVLWCDFSVITVVLTLEDTVTCHMPRSQRQMCISLLNENDVTVVSTPLMTSTCLQWRQNKCVE